MRNGGGGFWVLRGGACDEFKPMMDRRGLTSTGQLRE